MKQATESQRQWVWFIALCCGGFVAALLLAYVARLVIANL